jgi:hypothetical protein
MAMTSPSCRASDQAYMTTLAYCMNTKWGGVPAWQLEEYWATAAATVPTVAAKWDYRTALEHVAEAPTMMWAMGMTLNHTMLAPEAGFRIQSWFIPVMYRNSTLLFRYA